MLDVASTRRRTLVGAAAGAMLVLGGATATAASTPAGAAAGRPAAVARAEHDLLRRSDFPAGWTASPMGTTGAGQTVGVDQIAACVGVPGRSFPADPPRATDPEFDQTTEDLSVDEEVTVFPTTTAAAAAFSVFADPRASTCAAAYLRRTGPHFTVRRLSFPALGARSTGLALSLPVTADGRTVTTLVDDVFVLTGRTEVVLDLTALGSPFPAALARSLATTAAGRAAR